MTDAEVYAGSVAMGAVTGMRSMSGPAILSHVAKSGLDLAHKQGLLDHPATGKTTIALTAVEMLADKLPFMPKRTKKGSLLGRAISGGLSGAAVASGRRRSAVVGAALGAVGAVGAAYAIYHLRRQIAERLNWPDPIVGLAEDIAVAGIGMLIASKLRSRGIAES